MTARYVEIGQYPDTRREVRGTLAEILVSTANPGTYAAPEDVTGTFLEMGTDGQWTGASVGTLTQVEADALVASGALASVKVGTPGTVAGTLVRYGGVGVGWIAAGGEIPYVGSIVPATRIARQIEVDNPAVPCGRSVLTWGCKGYRLAAGEMLAGGFPPDSSSALVLLSPATTNRVIVWQSEVIPDYLLPDGLEWTISLYCGVQNPAPSGNNIVGAGVTGTGLPADDVANYPAGINTGAQASPNYGGSCGFGAGNDGLQIRRGTQFRHPLSFTRTTYAYPSFMGSFAAGANRLMVGVKLAQADSQIRLDSVVAYSRGNL
jgi:hypothetical protein